MLFKKLFSDTLFAYTANILVKLINAIIVIILANYLGPDNYGIYATAIAFVGIFLVFRDLGTKALMIQECSKDKSKTPIFFGNITLIQIILIFVIYPAILIIAKICNYPPVTISLIAILGLAQLIFEQRRSANALLRLHLKIKTISIFELIQGLANIIIVFLIAKIITSPSMGLFDIAWAQLFLNIIMVATLFIYIAKKIVKPCYDFSTIIPTLRKAMVFGLSEFFYLFYFQVDQVVISILRSPYEVAIYSLPFKIISFFLFVPQILFGIIQPVQYKTHVQDLEKYKRIFYFVHRNLCAIGIPAGIAIIILATPIMHLLFQDKYNASILVLQLFGLFLIIRFINSASGHSLTTQYKQPTKTKIQGALIIINLIFDIILVHYYGYIGAVFTTLAVETIMDFLYIYYNQKYLGEKMSKIITTIWPVFGASLAMGIIIFLLRNHLNVIIVSITGLIIYCLFLYLFKFFRPYDLKLLKQLIHKKPKKFV